jgi:hypothetical protein
VSIASRPGAGLPRSARDRPAQPQRQAAFFTHDRSPLLHLRRVPEGRNDLAAQASRLSSQVSLPPRKELRYFDAIHYHDFRILQRQRLRQFSQRFNNFLKDVRSSDRFPANAKELDWNFRYAVVDRENYNDEWYESLFSKCDPEKLTGDFSPNYSLLPAEGVEHMRRVAPNGKIVFILRDPVERLWSGSVYALRDKISAAGGTVDYRDVEAEGAKDIQRLFSRYSRIIPLLDSTFGQENVLYLFYDDIQVRPMDVLRQFSAFFGLDHKDSWFRALDERVNEGPKVSRDDALVARMAESLAEELTWLANRFPEYGEAWRGKYLAR